MFEIPNDLLEYWKVKAIPKVATEEISLLENYVGKTLPNDYVDCLKTFGSVVFSMDLPDSFSANFIGGGEVNHRLGSIKYISRPEKYIKAHSVVTRIDPDDGLPFFRHISTDWWRQRPRPDLA